MTKFRKKRRLSPEDILRIREKVGLTQSEAGNLLGGGPNAFYKYETDVIRPTTSMEALLIILDAYPRAVGALRRKK